MKESDYYWIQYYFRCTGIIVIESLPESWKTGKELYDDIIKRNSEKINYQSYYYAVFDKKEFFELMNDVVNAVLNKKHFPILHFEIHGSEEGNGFVLASGELVPWTEFAVFCRKINVFSKNELVISLSTCHGAQIYQSLDFNKPAPFWGYLAPKTAMKTGELYDDYINFYECFLTEKDLAPAVEKIKLFDDNCPYVFVTAELVFDKLWEMAKLSPPKFPEGMSRLQKREAVRDENNPLSGDLYWNKRRKKFLIR